MRSITGINLKVRVRGGFSHPFMDRSPSHPVVGGATVNLFAAPHLPPGDRDNSGGFRLLPWPCPRPKGRRNLPPRRPFPFNLVPTTIRPMLNTVRGA
jgi:hypothetical protein